MCDIKDIEIVKFEPKNIHMPQKLIDDYIKLYKPDDFKTANDVLPEYNEETIKFKIINCCTEMANAIRRTILEDVEVYSLTFDIEDFESNDIYLLYDKIKDRIEGIPIDQYKAKELYTDGYNITLNVTNRNMENIDVLSNNIVVKDSKNANVPTTELIPKNIVLVDDTCFILSPETRTFIGKYYLPYKFASYMLMLKIIDSGISLEKLIMRDRLFVETRPLLENLGITKNEDKTHLFTYRGYNLGLHSQKNITIRNIKIEKGSGKKNANLYSSTSGYTYRFLESNKEYNNFVDIYKTCEMSYTTYGNIKSKDIIIMCFDILLKNINDYILVLSEIKSKDDIPVYKDILSIEKESNIYKIILNKNVWTYCMLIAKYCYLADKSLELVTCDIKHPNERSSYILLKHSEPIKLLLLALNNIKTDLMNMKAKF